MADTNDQGCKSLSNTHTLSCMMTYGHIMLDTCRDLFQKKSWLTTKLDEIKLLVLRLSEQYRGCNSVIYNMKTLNEGITLSLNDAKWMKAMLNARIHVLEAARSELLVEHSNLLAKLDVATEHAQSSKLNLCKKSDELLQQINKVNSVGPLLENRKEAKRTLLRYHRRLATTIKNKSELMQSRSLMLWSRHVDMNNELMHVKIRTESIERAIANLKCKRDEKFQELCRRHNDKSNQESYFNLDAMRSQYLGILDCAKYLWKICDSVLDSFAICSNQIESII